MGGVSCICGPQSEVQRHGWVPNGDAEVPAEMKGRKWLNMSSIRTTDFFPGPSAASPPASGERCVGRRLHRRISSPFFPTTSKATGRTRQSCLGGGLEVCSPLLLPLRLAVIVSAADPCFAEPGTQPRCQGPACAMQERARKALLQLQNPRCPWKEHIPVNGMEEGADVHSEIPYTF